MIHQIAPFNGEISNRKLYFLCPISLRDKQNNEKFNFNLVWMNKYMRTSQKTLSELQKKAKLIFFLSRFYFRLNFNYSFRIVAKKTRFSSSLKTNFANVSLNISNLGIFISSSSLTSLILNSKTTFTLNLCLICLQFEVYQGVFTKTYLHYYLFNTLTMVRKNSLFAKAVKND